MRSVSLTGVAAGALFIAVGGCNTKSSGGLEAARMALRDADSAYAQAMFGKDRSVFVGFYTDDAIAYPPAEATAASPDSIGALADALWSQPDFGGSARPVALEVSDDGTMGYTLNTVELNTTGPGGSRATQQIRDFHVWRRQPDGSWRIAIDIWNDEAASLGTSAPGDATAAITASWETFESAWLAGDVPGATSAFFTPEAINVGPDATESLGREAIDASFSEFFATNKVTALERTTDEVEVFGDLAYERGHFRQTTRTRDGAALTQQSRYLAIWKRQPDGSWRCHRFLFNNAPRAV
jgi:uncharacterized protein (TIGR02246 family)